MKVILLGAVLALTTGTQVIAGEARIVASAHEPTVQSAELQVTANAFNLQKQSEGIWKFSFTDGSTPEARLVVVVNNPPSGYTTVKWEFDIPYYWDGTSTREFAVAMSNDQSGDPNTVAFLNSARQMSMKVATIGQLALLNQRARKIFVERHARVAKGNRSAEKDDVSVAYWLLLSSRELMEKSGLVPDDITKLAATWVLGISESSADAERLLGTDTVPPDEARNLVASLQRRDEVFTERIVRQISKHIGATRSRDNGCARARGLKAKLQDLDEETLLQRDPTLRFSLETTTNVALCTVRELQSALVTQPKAIPDLTDAKALHDDMMVTIAAMEEAKREPELRRRAGNHATELLAIIRSIEGRATAAPAASESDDSPGVLSNSE
jgi:hypothetical protein